jgi:hypothetical protein
MALGARGRSERKRELPGVVELTGQVQLQRERGTLLLQEREHVARITRGLLDAGAAAPQLLRVLGGARGALTG